MKKINFNSRWKVVTGSTSSMMTMLRGGGSLSDVQLPHDAMIHEAVTEDTPSGAQTGFYPGAEYIYIKKFEVPDEWEGKTTLIEFEGVYQTAMVYINGSLAGRNLHGYSNFYICMDKYLKYHEENEIKVIADNASVPNSRWYSGSGIYRNVNLYLGNEVHIPADGVQLTTLYADEETAVVEVQTEINNYSRKRLSVHVDIEILKNETIAARDSLPLTLFPDGKDEVRQSLSIIRPELWSCESPELYRCIIRIRQDEKELDKVEESLGIRTLQLDKVHGLRINGKEVKLRGTCIHHDNGILGAATFSKAEERRCRQIKEAGFNSIRSAHNPLSKAMLDACDRYGILVMDELSDMWTYHKNPQDFALHFADCLEDEVQRMVKKDYNHPSVIFYSSGNEIPELGLETGAEMNRRICNLIHKLDHTRYTTTGINGMMAVVFSCGLDKVLCDIIPDFQNEDQTLKDSGRMEGANAFNSYLSVMNDEKADIFASHPFMTKAIEESALAADVTGLNYLTGRHVLEKEIHPNRTVIGTETYPADIVRLWKIVKENPHVLGDYTWTGYDYLGEAGCGIFHYDEHVNFSRLYPERASYIGDINLIGYRRPVSYLREIVYGLRKEPYIAVERVNRYGMKCSKSQWMIRDNIASWTWQGYEGKPAIVDVYSNSEKVELFLNGKSLGKKMAGEMNGFIATFETNYEVGELLAISYDGEIETGRFQLETADEKVEMQVDAEQTILNANGEDLAFITVRLVDAAGRENMWAKKNIHVEVTGVGTLQAFGSAEPSTEKSYDDPNWETFDGAVMAVVRSGFETGKICVTFTADGCQEQSVEFEVQ